MLWPMYLEIVMCAYYLAIECVSMLQDLTIKYIKAIAKASCFSKHQHFEKYRGAHMLCTCLFDVLNWAICISIHLSSFGIVLCPSSVYIYIYIYIHMCLF